jgi:phosphatidylglycerophosphate synthase
MPDSAQSPRLPADTIRRNLPNALTILRLFLAAGFFFLLTPWTAGDRLFHDSRPNSLTTPNWTLLAAAGMFLLAAATDALDGFLARRWKVESVFGRIMDPFADKVLIVGAFIYMAGPAFHIGPKVRGGEDFQVTGVEPWMVVVALARELLVTSIRAVLEGRGVAFPAEWAGKIKMILQATAVPAILVTLAVADARHGAPGRLVILGLVWVTVVMTVLSGLPYILRAMSVFAKAPASSRPRRRTAAAPPWSGGNAE